MPKDIVQKKQSAPSARSAFDYIVGLNLYELLTIAVMVSIMTIMLVIVIVPIAVRVPAVAFNIPPAVRMLPAVMPRVAQIHPRVFRLSTLVAVVLDGLVQTVVSSDNALLAFFVGLCNSRSRKQC